MGCIADTSRHIPSEISQNDGEEDVSGTIIRHHSIDVDSGDLTPVTTTHVLSPDGPEHSFTNCVGITVSANRSKNPSFIKKGRTQISRRVSPAKLSVFNDTYKSSPEQSEIKDHETSATNSKRTKSNRDETRKSPQNYQSSSREASAAMVENEHSGTHEFDSITKLTATAHLMGDTVNNSGQETMIENDSVTTKTMSVRSTPSVEHIPFTFTQSHFKRQNAISPKYQAIENPFYLSEDEERDADYDESDSSYYHNNSEWFQSVGAHSVISSKASNDPSANRRSNSKTPLHFVPHAMGDRIKPSSIYSFRQHKHPSTATTQSMTSSVNSMKAQVSFSGETLHTIEDNPRSRCNYNPFRPALTHHTSTLTQLSSHNAHGGTDTDQDSEQDIDVPPPFIQDTFHSETFSPTPCLPSSHHFHPYDNSDPGERSDSTHI